MNCHATGCIQKYIKCSQIDVKIGGTSKKIGYVVTGGKKGLMPSGRMTSYFRTAVYCGPNNKNVRIKIIEP